MTTKNFCGEELSALGMGAMRLPVAEGDDSRVDFFAVKEMVDWAMEHGINYYDTAWGYHGGQSEIAMGKALAAHPRERFYLADKFPGYDLSNMPKVKEIFEQQLSKCGVDYFDFYLFHNVCEMNIDAYLNEEAYGIFPYLIEQKRKGRIRHLGFSAHGSREVIERFLNAYGRDMEFCQLQINYVDWDFQNARGKKELLDAWNIPVWVMEPLRGGKLAKLSEKDAARLKELRPQEEIFAWAFRFLQSIPGIGVTLSGMSNLEQLKKNIAVFEQECPLSQTEMETLLAISREMLGSSLPCTSCRYCTSHCPKGLDIPMLLGLYNEHTFTGGGFLAPMALMAQPEEKHPSACIGCRSCEKVCPQQIKVSEAMADFASRLKA